MGEASRNVIELPQVAHQKGPRREAERAKCWHVEAAVDDQPPRDQNAAMSRLIVAVYRLLRLRRG